MKYIVPVPKNKIHEWNKRKSPAHVGRLKNSAVLFLIIKSFDIQYRNYFSFIYFSVHV
jgi:hypothetical protein